MTDNITDSVYILPQPRNETQRKRPKYTRSKTGCLTCRIKKIKCDETRPICMRCTHGQRDCTWSEAVPTRKKVTPCKEYRKKATPRKEYVDGWSSTAESSDVSEPSTPSTRDGSPQWRPQSDDYTPPSVTRRHSEPVVSWGADPELSRREISSYPYQLHRRSQKNVLSMIPEMPPLTLSNVLRYPPQPSYYPSTGVASSLTSYSHVGDVVPSSSMTGSFRPSPTENRLDTQSTVPDSTHPSTSHARHVLRSLPLLTLPRDPSLPSIFTDPFTLYDDGKSVNGRSHRLSVDSPVPSLEREAPSPPSHLNQQPGPHSSVELPYEMSSFSAYYPPPPNLTHHIIKTDNQYIAGGGFGDVYRCWYFDTIMKEVAVKAFRFTSTLDGCYNDRSVKMFRRELGIWRRLNHPNVVPFLGIAYGFGMRGAMSLVSLWMPNESLSHCLAKHGDYLELGHRLRFLQDVVHGLHYLHSFPVVHGDLNCNNVLLDVDYTARLADFGYASLVGNIPEALTYLQRSTVRPGALRWIAPEQIESEEMFSRTPKSDIYSFGCVTLQVLTGQQPWSEVREDAAVVLRLAKGHKPSRPASRMMDDSHWDFIQECWSSIDTRPTTDEIIPIIQGFSRQCAPVGSLSDLFTAK